MNPMRSLQHRQINAPNDIHFHKYLHKIEKKKYKSSRKEFAFREEV